MSVRANVITKTLVWARERARLPVAGNLHKKFRQLADWESGAVKPTYRELDRYAEEIHHTGDYFCIAKPRMDVTDVRHLQTVGNCSMKNPSFNLLDTLIDCEERQEWYHDYLEEKHREPGDLIGSVGLRSKPEKVAARIRCLLGFDGEGRQKPDGRRDVFWQVVERTEAMGVLVMVSDMVGANPGRRLNVREFRGFALSDDLAPLLFVNAADTRAGQMLTLVCGLACLLLGKSALLNVRSGGKTATADKVEQWCRQVAAGVLLVLMNGKNGNGNGGARHRNGGNGGDKYEVQISRVGKTFARAVMGCMAEYSVKYVIGRQLLGLPKSTDLLKMAEKLGVDF